MLDVARMFDIKPMTTLELMSLMLKCGHINMNKVKETVAYWEYISDKPANFRKSYIRIFGENPP